MALTSAQIEKLASMPKVKRIAVENFLSSDLSNKSNAYENLRMDSRLYKWNTPTVNAISKGISMY